MKSKIFLVQDNFTINTVFKILKIPFNDAIAYSENKLLNNIKTLKDNGIGNNSQLTILGRLNGGSSYQRNMLNLNLIKDKFTNNNNKYKNK